MFHESIYFFLCYFEKENKWNVWLKNPLYKIILNQSRKNYLTFLSFHVSYLHSSLNKCLFKCPQTIFMYYFSTKCACISYTCQQTTFIFQVIPLHKQFSVVCIQVVIFIIVVYTLDPCWIPATDVGTCKPHYVLSIVVSVFKR